MKRITVTIEADITLEMTREEEKIIRKMRNAENSEDWGSRCKLENKLEKLIEKRIFEEMESVEDVVVHDIDYEL